MEQILPYYALFLLRQQIHKLKQDACILVPLATSASLPENAGMDALETRKAIPAYVKAAMVLKVQMTQQEYVPFVEHRSFSRFVSSLAPPGSVPFQGVRAIPILPGACAPSHRQVGQRGEYLLRIRSCSSNYTC